MVRTCFVPFCKSGLRSGPYSSSGISMFAFPSDEQRKKYWTNSIGREDREPTRYSRVCSVHFEEHFIIRKFQKYLDDGTLLEHHLTHPVLREDALPTIFKERAAAYRLAEERLPSGRLAKKQKTEAEEPEDPADDQEIIGDLRSLRRALRACLPKKIEMTLKWQIVPKLEEGQNSVIVGVFDRGAQGNPRLLISAELLPLASPVVHVDGMDMAQTYGADWAFKKTTCLQDVWEVLLACENFHNATAGALL